ncbi:MAG: TIGR02450 family Trp-rich protein [Cyanobacteria bacterium J06641_5]
MASCPFRAKKRKQQGRFPHLVGSKWTACQTTWGWRHFQVAARQDEGRTVFAEMVASCDPAARFWLNAEQLKDSALWMAGWKTLAEIQDPVPDDESDLLSVE